METLWRLFTNVVRFVVIFIVLLITLVVGGVDWFVVITAAFVLLYSLHARTSLFVDLQFRERHKRD